VPLSELWAKACRTFMLSLGCVWLSTAAACGGTPIAIPSAATEDPRLLETAVHTADGFLLPLHRWMPPAAPAAVVLALHGFNDYGGGFESLARALIGHDIAVYAYDQRGFGATERRDAWHGQAALASDAVTVANLLRERYSDLPIYLAGESMGGAVAVLAMTSANPPPVDGLVLLAPAITDVEALPWYQRFALWLGTQVAPGAQVSIDLAETLGVRLTDQPWVTDQLRENPLVKQSARIETLEYLSEMMTNALDAIDGLDARTLLLIGERDEVLPPHSMCPMLEHWPPRAKSMTTVVVYREGHHLLTRYSRRMQTFADVADWVHGGERPLSSGRGQTTSAAREALCD
jgi:acylglycerol lipase